MTPIQTLTDDEALDRIAILRAEIIERGWDDVITFRAVNSGIGVYNLLENLTSATEILNVERGGQDIPPISVVGIPTYFSFISKMDETTQELSNILWHISNFKEDSEDLEVQEWAQDVLASVVVGGEASGLEVIKSLRSENPNYDTLVPRVYRGELYCLVPFKKAPDYAFENVK